MRKLFSIHKRAIGLGLMGAFVVALAALGGLFWANQSASAHPPPAAIRIVAVDVRDGNGLVAVTPDTSITVPRDSIVRVCDTNDEWYGPAVNIDHHIIPASYSEWDSMEANTSDVEGNTGSQPTVLCANVSGAALDHFGGRTTVWMTYTDSQGTAVGTDDEVLTSNNVYIFWLSIKHLSYNGIEIAGDPVNKVGSYHRIVTEGFQLHNRDANCNVGLTGAGTLPCWRWATDGVGAIIDRSALNGMDEAARGFLCEADGTPVSGPLSEYDDYEASDYILELCLDITSDVEGDSLIGLGLFDPPSGGPSGVGYFPNTLVKSWVENPVTLIHTNPDGTDELAVDDDGDGFYDPEVDAYWIDDNNNITSMYHMVRTVGWQPNFVLDEVILQNSQGATATVVPPGPGRCGDIVHNPAIEPPKYMWDNDDGDMWWDEDPVDLVDNDGDTLIDEDPAGSLRDNELCILIHSMDPGETLVSISYHDEGVVDEPGLGADDSIIEPSNVLVKEWDKLEYTVILKAPDLDDDGEPIDADGDTYIDVYDLDILDRQGTNETDEVILDKAWPEGERLRSASGPVRLVEIVIGAHTTDEYPSWDDPWYHPTEGAVIHAEITQGNCTYFTNPLLRYDFDGDTVIDPADGDVIRPGGLYDFGDAVEGYSNDGGRFVGPQVQPEDAQVPFDSLYPNAHTGTAPQFDQNMDILGSIPWTIEDLWVDTTCEEQATITIDVGYPGAVGSMPQIPETEEITINWMTVEEAKQPQIRWAGEKIVLAKRWALPGEYYPEADANGDTIIDVGDACPLAGQPVKYVKLDGPGALIGEFDDEADTVWTVVDDDCTTRIVYKSEEPGQVDVDAILYEGTLDVPGDMLNEHGFVVWYLKIYQVKLTNLDGARADHNSGAWDTDVLTAAEDTKDTLNVSADTLLKIQVKGFFMGGNLSGRGAVCVDLDGDGDGNAATTTDVPGEPYALDQYETGCTEDSNGDGTPDDEIVEHGHWVLPDDIETLAGAFPGFTRSSWDVMSDIDEDPSALTDGIWIGPKSTLDSHDPVGAPVARVVVPCVILDENGDPDFTCLRKTVDPDGEITDADAIMPPLKIRALIDDPLDAGFLKQADKDDDVGITSLYQQIEIPADPEIPPYVNDGGYDVASYGWAGIPAQGPYEFYHVFNYPVIFLDGCDPATDTLVAGPGPLCNSDIGNQDDDRSDDVTHPRIMEFYTDNRGQGYFFANGDYNLSFDDCPTQALTGTPDCSPDDVVGTSTIQVIGDYPYERKHPSLWSNPVIKTWTWGGFKDVTAEPLDPNHTAIIAHLKDRDGYCKYTVGTDPFVDGVVFSPSEHPVQHEEITFQVTSGGQIWLGGVGISPNAIFNVPHTPLAAALQIGWQDGVQLNETQAVALAEDARVLGAGGFAKGTMEDDECQAWIIIEHAAGEVPEVSVIFDDPEGTITRHWPPATLTVNLIAGWNDACYIASEQPIEVALADLLVDSDGNTVLDLLAVYRFKAPTYGSDQTWDYYFPGRPDLTGQMTTLAPYDQLILLMEVNTDWEQNGATAAPPVSIDMVHLWNSVCYAGASKTADAALSSIAPDMEVLYTLANDMTWRLYAPDRPDLTNISYLDQFTSVFALITNPAGTTWIFNP